LSSNLLRASSESVFIMLHLWPGLLLSIDILDSFHSRVMGYWYLDHGYLFPSGLLFFQVTDIWCNNLVRMVPY
jgi:hypothetical protein